MNTAQFIQRVRETTQLPINSEDWPSNEILREASTCLLERFTQPVQTVRSGYWLQTLSFTTTPGVNWYRLPPRAIVQGLELQCVQPTGSASTAANWYQLTILTNSQAIDFQGVVTSGSVRWFSFENDGVVLYPTPQTAQNIQFKYYLRPANLVNVPGTIATNSGNDLATNVLDVTGVLGSYDYVPQVTGVVTNVANTPTQITFTVEWNTSVPPTASAGTKYDLVNLDGTSEAVILDMPLVSYTNVSTVGTAVFTYAASTLDLAKIRTDRTMALVPSGSAWTVPLPIEMHGALVAYTSAVILMDKGDIEKATQVISRCEASVKKIVDMMTPRIKDRPYTFKTRNTFLRRRAGYRWRF